MRLICSILVTPKSLGVLFLLLALYWLGFAASYILDSFGAYIGMSDYPNELRTGLLMAQLSIATAVVAFGTFGRGQWATLFSCMTTIFLLCYPWPILKEPVNWRNETYPFDAVMFWGVHPHPTRLVLRWVYFLLLSILVHYSLNIQAHFAPKESRRFTLNWLLVPPTLFFAFLAATIDRSQIYANGTAPAAWIALPKTPSIWCYFSDLAYSRSRNIVALGQIDREAKHGRVYVWDTQRDTWDNWLEGSCSALDVSPNGNWVAASGAIHPLIIWNTRNKTSHVFRDNLGFSRIHFLDDERYLVAVRKMSLFVWDFHEEKVVSHLDVPDIPDFVNEGECHIKETLISPDRRALALEIGHPSDLVRHSIQIVEITRKQTGSVRLLLGTRLSTLEHSVQLFMRPENDLVTSHRGQIMVWNTKTGRDMYSVTVQGSPERHSEGPMVKSSGYDVAIASRNGIEIWGNLTSWKRNIERTGVYHRKIMLAPDGKSIISLSHGSFLRFWPIQTDRTFLNRLWATMWVYSVLLVLLSRPLTNQKSQTRSVVSQAE